MENKTNLKDIVKKIFIAFMIMQPVLDIYMSLFDKSIQIVGVSLATVIRFALVFIMLVMTMIYARKNKSTKLFIGYAVAVLIYMVFHHINAVGFKVRLVEAKYSPFGELLYLARMCIPVVLIYIIYNIKLNYKDIKKIVISVSLILSLTMIISNLFKFSYLSYSLEQDTISGNMIEWFTKGIKPDSEKLNDWVGYTTRGLFQSGNQLSGVMIILVPILTYIAFKEKKIKEWIVLTLHIIAMITITTRVGAIGGILAMAATVCVYILEKIIHREKVSEIFKQKNFYCLIVSVVVIAVVYAFSPFKVRTMSGNFGADLVIGKQTTDNTNVDDSDGEIDKIAYIQENVEKEEINGYYIYQVYPYTDDVDFWFDLMMNVPKYERAGNRKMRALLVNRILERDNRISDYLVGISFTRSSSFVWPERDFQSQVDALGWIGMILFIFPYIFVFVFAVVQFLRKFKENLYLRRVVYMMALAVGMVAAYLSGHILNEIFPFVFLAMVAGITLNVAMGDEPENYEKKNELRRFFDKIYPDGEKKFFEEIDKDLKNEKKRFIVTANPETLMIANSNKELADCLLQEYVTIVPDGIGIIKGAKILGYPQKETITGVGLVEHLFKECNDTKKSVFLFGAKKEVVEKLKEVLEKDYPNIEIKGIENGYVEDRQKVFDEIEKLSPDLVLVALGIPAQELLINKNFEKFNKGIFIGVGGSFDVLSGTKKRAPKFFIKFHLEWLYRITTEPKRMKRFFDSNVKYLFKLSEEK